MISFYDVLNKNSIIEVKKKHKDMLIYEVFASIVAESKYTNMIIFSGDPGNFLYDNYPTELSELKIKIFNYGFSEDNIKILLKELSFNSLGIKIKLSDLKKINETKYRLSISLIDHNNAFLTASCVYFEKYGMHSSSILKKSLHLSYLKTSIKGLVEQKELFMAEVINNILEKNTFSPSFYEILRLSYYCDKKEVNKNELKFYLNNISERFSEFRTTKDMVINLFNFLDDRLLYSKISKYIKQTDYEIIKNNIVSKLSFFLK